VVDPIRDRRRILNKNIDGLYDGKIILRMGGKKKKAKIPIQEKAIH
jgi:hypothetical protein